MAVPHRNDVTVRTALGPDENHYSAIQPSCRDHAHVAQIGLFAGPIGIESVSTRYTVAGDVAEIIVTGPGRDAIAPVPDLLSGA
jgi:hypothetical protein